MVRKVHPSMRSAEFFPILASLLLGFSSFSTAIAVAQEPHHDTLTEAQVEKIREAGIDPNERIKLYTEFVNGHVGVVKSLMNRRQTDARARKLDTELHDISALMDELGSNLDQYSDRHADMRRSLKILADQSKEWLSTLRALAGESGFELSRKDAIEASDDLTNEAQRLFNEQNAYFEAHKDERGQERAEPKPQQ
jgi:hypothetical protein